MTPDVSTTESYLYELLDNQDHVLRTLGGVQPGGLLESSIHADIRSSASLRMRLTEEIDWLARRLRVSYVLNGVTTPLLTGIPAVKDEQADAAAGVELQVDLYDKTSILLGDSYGQAYAVPAGANLIAAAIAVIASAGETTIAIPASAATAATGLAWPATDSKLRIVNDLLTAAGYLSVWCDALGWYRAEPATSPADRPIRFELEPDGDPYLPTVARSYDPYEVPNRVRVLGATDGTTEAPMAEATDERIENPFSKLRRGFWRTHPETDVAAADLAGYAARRLVELQQVYEAHQVTHPWMPAGLNDAGRFRGRRVVIQKQRQRLSVGGLVTSTLRTVIE